MFLKIQKLHILFWLTAKLLFSIYFQIEFQLGKITHPSLKENQLGKYSCTALSKKLKLRIDFVNCCLIGPFNSDDEQGESTSENLNNFKGLYTTIKI